jgi:hypothetical protein
MAPPRRRHVLNAHLGNEHESCEGARRRRAKRERAVVGRASEEERIEKEHFVTHGSVAWPGESGRMPQRGRHGRLEGDAVG